MKDKDLASLNKQGFIPGPLETEDAYIKRVEYCKNLNAELPDLKAVESEASAKELLREAIKLTKPLYDIAPYWIPVLYSNEQLAPWHGGCAWIFQMSEKSPTGAFFQLRSKFKDKSTLYGTYSRDELSAHELCHAGRMMFHEPKFEEMLAYRSSKSPFRRVFGPIFESPTETLWFAIVLIFIFMLDFGLLYFGNIPGYATAVWLKGIPVSWLIYAIFRLFSKRRHFFNTLAALKELYDEEAANAIIYRMLDREIIEFGKLAKNERAPYIGALSKQSLRWKVIALSYNL